MTSDSWGRTWSYGILETCTWDIPLLPKVSKGRFDPHPFTWKTPTPPKDIWTSGAQKSHRKITATTVAASGLATIPLQKSQSFSFRWPQRIASRQRFWGLASKSQEAHSDHGRKSPQPRDFAAAATTGHQDLDPKVCLLGKMPKGDRAPFP